MGSWQDFRDPEPFDTVLALMGGTGLAGTLPGLPVFLDRVAALLSPGGELLVDSADLLDPDDPAADVLGDGRYPGELQVQLEYRGERGDPFPHLFVDPLTLRETAEALGWRCAVVEEGEGGTYLARLAPMAGGPASLP